ncbi:bacteriohemerythrin [Clostridium pasteurianum]|uniref:Hemerythrin-like metal-binding domain-containing protein n=1 Tax=Clostridium pasteurianum BC1 TaxID=86416 RepID=R4K114_CLOPA|nr:hemerythrin family protein [Clostridium pasteurianum]AGK95451.1 hemerythrin-like metal-binding domain-containing protein [Clostridium pasteurianum BC1]
MLKWKDDYLLGIDKIDEQHKELFRVAERAYNLLKSNYFVDKYNKIVEIIGKLKDYTIFHFQEEEKYMLSIKYKRFFAHKIEHDEFIEQLNKVELKDVDENQDKYILGLLEFVVKWINDHIIGQDLKIIED